MGENPHAAESVGISVTRIRTTAYLIAGAVAGLGGAFMSMSYVAWFSRDMVAGRGFIGLSANNIANGSPVVATIFSMLFGMADTVANILQLTDAGIAYFVKMLPYVITIVGMVVMSVFQIRRRKHMKQKAVAAAIQEEADRLVREGHPQAAHGGLGGLAAEELGGNIGLDSLDQSCLQHRPVQRAAPLQEQAVNLRRPQLVHQRRQVRQLVRPVGGQGPGHVVEGAKHTALQMFGGGPVAVLAQKLEYLRAEHLGLGGVEGVP